MIVKGTSWAAAVSPVILSIGSLFTEVNQDVLDIHPMGWRDWFDWIPFINKKPPGIDLKAKAEY